MSRTEKQIYEAAQKEQPFSVMFRNTVCRIKGILYGLLVGSADYVGWTPVVITEDMVGQTVAVFTSWEIKTETDELEDEQVTWYKAVKRDGGIARVIKESFGVLTDLQHDEIINGKRRKR